MKPSPALVESPERPSRRSGRTPKKKENSDYVTPTKSREKRNETPRKRKASIENQVTPVKTPAKTPKKELSSRQATPAKKIQVCVVKLQHCDDQSVEQILDIANMNYNSKRRKASSKPNLDDVTEVSTEDDDDDDDTRETMKVCLQTGVPTSFSQKSLNFTKGEKIRESLFAFQLNSADPPSI